MVGGNFSNVFLCRAYLVVGVICFLTGCVLFFTHKKYGKLKSAVEAMEQKRKV